MDDEKAFDDFLSIDTTLCIGAEQPTEENNIYIRRLTTGIL